MRWLTASAFIETRMNLWLLSVYVQRNVHVFCVYTWFIHSAPGVFFQPLFFSSPFQRWLVLGKGPVLHNWSWGWFRAKPTSRILPSSWKPRFYTSLHNEDGDAIVKQFTSCWYKSASNLGHPPDTCRSLISKTAAHLCLTESSRFFMRRVCGMCCTFILLTLGSLPYVSVLWPV